MTKICFILGMLLMGMPGNMMAQIPVDWEDLSEVVFDFAYNPELKKLASNPSFSPEIQALSGQRIRVTGYIIPMKATEKAYALSEFPNAACFFCGNAGLETIMELRLRKKRTSFKTDEIRTFTGILRLSSNIEELPFILEDATVE